MSVSTQSEYITAWRRWSTQYPGSIACCFGDPRTRPVRHPWNGRRDSVIDSRCARNSPRIGSSSLLCAAVLTLTRWNSTPSPSDGPRSPEDAASPDTTHRSGVLTTARSSPNSSMSGRSSVGDNGNRHCSADHAVRQLAAQNDEPQALRERHRSRDARGGVLTDAVSCHRGGLDAPALQEHRERVLDDEDRWELISGRLQLDSARSTSSSSHSSSERRSSPCFDCSNVSPWSRCSAKTGWLR